ncbi:unnamed protein product [Caenorhabditis bovis]|uniref:Uncharacterized protein n=1 Tax=Caenorhabditis bovis TaxID=2654633 RepID=A0A8S1ELI9_9PELO|nr:unnamed protein product [Caenorhabditis bovis]
MNNVTNKSSTLNQATLMKSVSKNNLRTEHCECVAFERKKRNVEELFGLKSYKSDQVVQDSLPAAIPEKLEACSWKSFGKNSKIELSKSVIQNYITSSLHAATAKNCWTICSMKKTSVKEPCNAIAFNPEHSKKPHDDCFLLSNYQKMEVTDNTENLFEVYQSC